MISGNDAKVGKLSHELKRSLLFAIEKTLCPKISADLEKRAKQLADLDNENLIAEYMQSEHVKMFKELCSVFFQHDVSFQNLPANLLDDLISKYLESQINFEQCVKLEMDVITISQFVRKYLGIDQAILLLRNIHDSNYKLSELLAELKEKSAENSVKFSLIENMIRRLRNFYFHADIKREYYVSQHLESHITYLHLLEAMLWINGQRETCIVGMEEIKTGKKPETPYEFSTQKDEFTASPVHGARKLIESTIGIMISDHLLSIENELSDTSVEAVLAQLKELTIYKQVVNALDNPNGTRAGFNTYLAGQPKEVILRLIDDYLLINIHLAQPLQYERNIVRISQYLHQEYDIDTAIRLLNEIHLLSFDAEKFFANRKMPTPEILGLIKNINQFYLFADIKRNDNFFDEEEPQAKKLAESVMWVSKQRQYCIQGMTLIDNKQAHTGKQISFKEEDIVKYVPRNIQPAAVAKAEPSELKKPKLVKKSSFERPRQHYFDYSQLQQTSEEEALRIALQQSEREAREARMRMEDDNALQLALELSRQEVRPVVPQKSAQELKEDLFKHCASGNLAEVRRHIEELNVDIRSLGPLRNQPIHIAASNNHDEVIAYLVQRGASLNETNSYQQTALQLSTLVARFHRAALNNDIRTMQSYLQRFRLSVDCINENHKTALMIAAEAGHVEAARFLVEDHHANIDIVGVFRNKALHYAAMSKRLEMMAYLITKGASPVEVNSYNQSPHAIANLGDLLCTAAETENYDQIRFLLGELRLPVDTRNSHNKTALMAAIEKLKLPVVRFLIEECHANMQLMGTFGYKPLHIAANLKSLPIMEYLISKGASTLDKTSYQATAIDLLGGADMLCAAARAGDNERIRYLLTNIKILVNNKDSQNKTALMAAIEAGKLVTVKFLLEECQADMNISTTYNSKAIHIAAQHNQEEIAAYLVSRGASMREMNSYGSTPEIMLNLTNKFIAAAMHDDVAEMQRYVECFRLDPTVQGQSQKSALIVAAENGRLNAVKYLVENLNVSPRTINRGLSAALFAHNNKHHDVAAYLVAKGADPIPEAEKPVVQAAAPAQRVDNLPAAEFTVLDDALMLLNRLQAVARLRDGKKDDADAPGWGTSDEEEERYQANHAAIVKLADTHLTQERFNAATSLLDEFKTSMRLNENGEEYRFNQLECMLMAGTQQICVSAKYNLNVISQQLGRGIYNSHDLAAPITLYPFDKLRNAVMNALHSCFTGWQEDASNPAFATKTVPYQNIIFYYMATNTLYKLQEMYGEVEKDFDMRINHTNFADQNTYTVSVHKESLQNVKNWIGYRSAFKNGAPPSLSEMVKANNSPIVARQQGRMVRSESMEKLQINKL